MTRVLLTGLKGEYWGMPFNRTPDRDTFGGNEPERRSSRRASSGGGGWRTAVVGLTIVASLASGVAIGRVSPAVAAPIHDSNPQAAPRLDFTDRLLDTNGPENRGR